MSIPDFRFARVVDELQECFDATLPPPIGQSSPFSNYEESRAIIANYVRACEAALAIIRQNNAERPANEFLDAVRISFAHGLEPSRKEERYAIKAGAARGMEWIQAHCDIRL